MSELGSQSRTFYTDVGILEATFRESLDAGWQTNAYSFARTRLAKFTLANALKMAAPLSLLSLGILANLLLGVGGKTEPGNLGFYYPFWIMQATNVVYLFLEPILAILLNFARDVPPVTLVYAQLRNHLLRWREDEAGQTGSGEHGGAVLAAIEEVDRDTVAKVKMARSRSNMYRIGVFVVWVLLQVVYIIGLNASIWTTLGIWKGDNPNQILKEGEEKKWMIVFFGLQILVAVGCTVYVIIAIIIAWKVGAIRDDGQRNELTNTLLDGSYDRRMMARRI